MSEDLSMIPHDLHVNGINLHYVTWGEFTHPERAVLLVHGLTANSQSWASLGPRLAAEGWYAIAPDLRGRGLSDKPPHGYGSLFHVNDLLSLCDALSLPTVHFIGHSMGALIGLFFAGTYPKRLGRLVLVDRGGRIPADALQAIGPSLQRLGQVYPSLDAYLAERRQSSSHEWTPLWEAYYRYDAQAHPDGTVTSRVPKAAVEEEFLVESTLNAEVALARIQAPTLLLRAALGTLAPDRGFIMTADEAERVQSIIPGCRVAEIPGTNHYTIITSEVFTREVVTFLAE
jgi:pimeloyl-ACP methyl ester carboxylesterase